MNKVISSFILTSLAGFSTIIGYFLIFLKGNKDKIVTFSLSFASGVRLTISIIDLIPSSFSYLNDYQLIFRLLLILFFFILGVFISSYISLKVDKTSQNSLKKVGIISMLAIILHNIPEGIITFMVSKVDFNLGIKLALAISMHNIPEGISIAIPYYYATKKKLKTFWMVLVSGISELLGAIICYLFLENYITNFLIGACFSIIAGIMITISLTELLKESLKYKEKKLTNLGLVIGSLVMIISHFIL